MSGDILEKQTFWFVSFLLYSDALVINNLWWIIFVDGEFCIFVDDDILV